MRLGGKNKASKRQANGKQTASKKENETENKNENEFETEEEDECHATGDAVSVFCRRVNPRPSPRCREELREFESVLGREVCLRAMDEAADAGKRSWAYIRGILRAKQEQGVRSLADWDRLEQARRAEKAGGGRPVPSNRVGTVPGVVNRAPDPRALEDMERIRRYMERMKQEG